MSKKDIFERLHSGESVAFDDPQYSKLHDVAISTMKFISFLNLSSDVDHIRKCLSEIIGSEIDSSSTIYPPFYVNLGCFTKIGKNVFINHACSFLDIGGITIEDNVLIGPKVNLITEGHPVNPAERRKLEVKPILIKENVWIGAGATILPGVTIGENSVVAAGAVVSKDVPMNTLVGGIPAKVIKKLSANEIKISDQEK